MESLQNNNDTSTGNVQISSSPDKPRKKRTKAASIPLIEYSTLGKSLLKLCIDLGIQRKEFANLLDIAPPTLNRVLISGSIGKLATAIKLNKLLTLDLVTTSTRNAVVESFYEETGLIMTNIENIVSDKEIKDIDKFLENSDNTKD